MNFIKGDVAFIYSCIACHCIYLGLVNILPWLFGLSWLWFVVMMLVINTFIYLLLFPVNFPLSLLLKGSPIAAWVIVLQVLYHGYKCVCEPWSNGISEFGAKEWIGSIVVTINIVRLFKEIIMCLFMVINSSKEE